MARLANYTARAVCTHLRPRRVPRAALRTERGAHRTTASSRHASTLAKRARFANGLLSISGLTLYDICNPAYFGQRTPTAAFRLAKRSPKEVAEHLARKGVYVWSGHFYALATTERLGIEETGGLVRASLTHYNTTDEVDYCLECLRELT
jgi:selenocysteine lyase/cysteine desulfurase